MRTEIEVRMDLRYVADEIVAECEALDAIKPTKAGMRRLRKLTLEIEKLGKEYRKSSVNKENGDER